MPHFHRNEWEKSSPNPPDIGHPAAELVGNPSGHPNPGGTRSTPDPGFAQCAAHKQLISVKITPQKAPKPNSCCVALISAPSSCARGRGLHGPITDSFFLFLLPRQGLCSATGAAWDKTHPRKANVLSCSVGWGLRPPGPFWSGEIMGGHPSRHAGLIPGWEHLGFGAMLGLGRAPALRRVRQEQIKQLGNFSFWETEIQEKPVELRSQCRLKSPPCSEPGQGHLGCPLRRI